MSLLFLCGGRSILFEFRDAHVVFGWNLPWLHISFLLENLLAHFLVLLFGFLLLVVEFLEFLADGTSMQVSGIDVVVPEDLEILIHDFE